MAETRSIWDQLFDEANPRCRAWAEHFRALQVKTLNAVRPMHPRSGVIEGRERELELLHAVLERPVTPVAILLGLAGTGKTAAVEELARRSLADKTHYKQRYAVLELRLGQLAATGFEKMQAILAELFDDLAILEKAARGALQDSSICFVLFIDEAHMLVTSFGANSKIGGDVIKDRLARPPIRIVAATTRREYDSTIAVDKPLAERFKQIELHELPYETVIKVLARWWQSLAPTAQPLPEDLLRYIVDANRMYRSDSAEPRKSIDLLEDLASYHKRLHKMPTRQTVEQIFSDRYSIVLSMKFDPDEVFGEIQRRIKGQPFALNVWHRLLKATAFKLDDVTNKPILTALMTGPTGVGKSESAKALAAALYPGEQVLLNINMPDYKTNEHEQLFRQRIGRHVRHSPNAIILLDEFEKAHESVRDSMLTILDEGLITFSDVNREGGIETNTVSLRNAIVLATTNAGANVFATDAKFSLQDGGEQAEKAEVDQLMKALVPNLQANGFKPEMLGRFNRIIPYRGLTDATFVQIAERQFELICSKLRDRYGIVITHEMPRQWPRDQFNVYTYDVPLYVAMVLAHAQDSNSGGARAIFRHMQTAVYDEIIEAMCDQPDCKSFHVAVSRDSQLYMPGAAATAGKIVVTPISNEGVENA